MIDNKPESGQPGQPYMRAMQIAHPGAPIAMQNLPVPEPGPNQVLVRVSTCGVCRTDLHILDGELPQTRYPVVPGHQVVGRVEAAGDRVTNLKPGDRVGIPWLARTCGHCRYCRSGSENLCEKALYTGCQLDGGYAEYCLAENISCLLLPDSYNDLEVAPLLCAGLIGYRAWRMAGDVEKIGFMGFGASAHILAQVAEYEGREVFAFTRKGDMAAQQLAIKLGATWAGSSDDVPPCDLDAVIIFAPAGELVPKALSLVRPGGHVVCAGIHMSDIPAFAYSLLWQERSICSVANLTRRDGDEFMALASRCHIKTEVHSYTLDQAALALDDLRKGAFTGAAVLQI